MAIPVARYLSEGSESSGFFFYAQVPLEFPRGSSGAITKGMQADEFQFVADPE